MLRDLDHQFLILLQFLMTLSKPSQKLAGVPTEWNVGAEFQIEFFIDASNCAVTSTLQRRRDAGEAEVIGDGGRRLAR